MLRAPEREEPVLSIRIARHHVRLIPKAAVDTVPCVPMGYGMTAAADGRWFPGFHSDDLLEPLRRPSSVHGSRRADLKAQGKISPPSITTPLGRELHPPSRVARSTHFRASRCSPWTAPPERQRTWLQSAAEPDWIYIRVGLRTSRGQKPRLFFFRMNPLSALVVGQDADVVPLPRRQGSQGRDIPPPGTNFRVLDIVKHVYRRQGPGRRRRWFAALTAALSTHVRVV